MKILVILKCHRIENMCRWKKFYKIAGNITWHTHSLDKNILLNVQRKIQLTMLIKLIATALYTYNGTMFGILLIRFRMR